MKTKRNNKVLKKAFKEKDDEFYTPRWYIEEMLELVDLTGKRILCPCDGEESEFVKLFKERGYDVTYAWGDYENCNTDDIDIIITNPPFSKFKQFYQWLKESGKDYIVIGSNLKVTIKEITDDIVNEKTFCDRTKNVEYHNGKKVSSKWYSTLDLWEKPKLKFADNDDGLYISEEGYLFINNIKHIRLKDNIWVSIGIFDYDYKDHFRLIKRSTSIKYKGKRVFARWLLELKDGSTD